MSKGLILVDVPANCHVCKILITTGIDAYACPYLGVHRQRDTQDVSGYSETRHTDCPIVPLPNGGLELMISELHRASNEIKNNRDSFTDLKTCALIESLYEALKGLISE